MKFLINKMQSQCISGQCYFQRNLFEVVLNHMLSDWKLYRRSRSQEFEVQVNLGNTAPNRAKFSVKFCKRRDRGFSN